MKEKKEIKKEIATKKKLNDTEMDKISAGKKGSHRSGRKGKNKK